jgi:hypothetical protein
MGHGVCGVRVRGAVRALVGLRKGTREALPRSTPQHPATPATPGGALMNGGAGLPRGWPCKYEKDEHHALAPLPLWFYTCMYLLLECPVIPKSILAQP